MIRIIWLFVWIWIDISAENCTTIQGTPPLFKCNQSEAQIDCPTGKPFVGCLYSFSFDKENNKTTWKGIEGRIEYYEEEDENLCKLNETEMNTIHVPCYTPDCTVDRDEAFKRCFNVTSKQMEDSQPMGIECGGQKLWKTIFPHSSKELRCRIKLETNTSGPLIEKIDSFLTERRNDSTCVMNNNNSIEYTCTKSSCDKEFKADLANIIPRYCRSHSYSAFFFQCQEKQKITNSFNTRIKQYCLYSWMNEEEKFVYNFYETAYASECIEYTFERKRIACHTNCIDMTPGIRDSIDYCGMQIEANRKGRQAVSVGFPIFFTLIILIILYTSGCTFLKARKAHSLLLHEYQQEFGSNPMSTSGSKKEKKKKRKELKGGGKEKKQRGDPPF